MKRDMRGNSVFAGLLLALGISLAGYFIADSIKYFRNFDHFVEVKGLSERVVKSDRATWQIGFNVSGNDLKQIYNQINSQQKAVSDFLLNEGFKSDDFNKQAISVVDNYANAYSNTNQARLPQYTATAGINVITSDVDLMTKAVGQTNLLVESGIILTSNMVNYSYSGLNAIKATMLDEALANAKVSANQFAKNSHSELGQIKNASQGLFTITAVDSNMNDASSIDKKIRVVTTVQFFLK